MDKIRAVYTEWEIDEDDCEQSCDMANAAKAFAQWFEYDEHIMLAFGDLVSTFPSSRQMFPKQLQIQILYHRAVGLIFPMLA